MKILPTAALLGVLALTAGCTAMPRQPGPLTLYEFRSEPPGAQLFLSADGSEYVAALNDANELMVLPEDYVFQWPVRESPPFYFRVRWPSGEESEPLAIRAQDGSMRFTWRAQEPVAAALTYEPAATIDRSR